MAIRNAIRLESLGRNVAAQITPELMAVMKEVRAAIEAFPSETLIREAAFRRFLQQAAPLFRGVNDRFLQTLSAELRQEVVEQAKWAERFLEASAPKGGITTAPISSPPAITLGPANFELGSAVTRTQLMALVDDTKVLGGRLTDLFGWGDAADSPYMKSVMKKIDRVVKAGFLAGDTNEQIAKNLAIATNGQIQDARAIARTAVMDMSQRAHERFWDANSDVVKLWEFDATFDYRVCPQCFPHDGKRVKDRSDLPSVPVHPNCRCRVLPLTATALELEKEDMAEGIKTSMVEINKNASTAKGRVYKTKARVGNRKYTKSSQDIEAPVGQRPTMGLFLLRANQETREAVLGKTNAKRFGEMVKGTDGSQAVLSANDALREIVKNPARRRK